ncbi:MAG: hypothetical protein WHT82_12610, partial [Limisphaera sp.]
MTGLSVHWRRNPRRSAGGNGSRRKTSAGCGGVGGPVFARRCPGLVFAVHSASARSLSIRPSELGVIRPEWIA